MYFHKIKKKIIVLINRLLVIPKDSQAMSVALHFYHVDTMPWSQAGNEDIV
jgi:hypothetical protein